jgi:hypothetical protein
MVCSLDAHKVAGLLIRFSGSKNQIPPHRELAADGRHLLFRPLRIHLPSFRNRMEPCGSMTKNSGRPQIFTISGHTSFVTDRSIFLYFFKKSGPFEKKLFDRLLAECIPRKPAPEDRLKVFCITLCRKKRAISANHYCRFCDRSVKKFVNRNFLTPLLERFCARICELVSGAGIDFMAHPLPRDGLLRSSVFGAGQDV